MAVDVSKLEAHELASPGRWHVFLRQPISMDAGMVQLVDGQTAESVAWPGLRRLCAGMGHELLLARSEDGRLVPDDEASLAEARACVGDRCLREPWASLLQKPASSDEGQDDTGSDDEFEDADTNDDQGATDPAAPVEPIDNTEQAPAPAAPKKRGKQKRGKQKPASSDEG